MARSFDFAVLRMAPDPARGEALNVGVVVFQPQRVELVFGEVLTRARHFYPSADQSLFDEAVGLFTRLDLPSFTTKERHRALSRIGLFELGDLGCFSLEDDRPETYQANVARLVAMFTGRRGQNKRPKGPPRLTTAVRSLFREEKVLAPAGDAAAIGNHKIVPDWPIPTRPSLKADLALKNRIMRVCEIVELKLELDGPPPASLFEGVVTLDVAQREVDAQQRVLAYRASGPAARVDEALAIARMHATTLVNWDVPQERDQFVHEWIDAAKDAGTPPMVQSPVPQLN